MKSQRYRAIYWSQIGMRKSIKHSTFKSLKYLYEKRKRENLTK
ncbi:hypothetical protein ORL59_19050 [Bacillus cereus]|nr:hypothetical protein [Bacillus cereus]MDZ4415680.1 hypothetical protein [Bacillus cereus]